MLQLEGVSKTIALPTREQLHVLRDISLTVEAGDSLAILGRSGSGKSTLLGLLGLLDRIDTGTYRVYGQETSGIGDRGQASLRGDVFGFVYQRFCLMPHLSAYENVEAPLRHGSGRRSARRAAVLGALEKVGLGNRARHRPDQLSGGEQQRVAIARALVREPQVVLADEPTGSLDVTTGGEVLELLTTLVKDAGVTLILVTHDSEIAHDMKRIVTITDGVLEEWKSRAEDRPDSLARRSFATRA